MSSEWDYFLQPGERLVPIDRSGWINTKNILSVGDEVIIAYSGKNFSHVPALFSCPVRARITALSDITLNMGLELRTPVPGWLVGIPLDGWFNVLWQIQGKIVKETNA